MDRILQELGGAGLPRGRVLAIVRQELARARRVATQPEVEGVMVAIRRALAAQRRARVQPVINGTGIVIHTNLGRAPLARSAVEAVAAVAAQYSNLELDLESGQRGSRAGYLEECLAALCGAGAATMVNNCAAALVLVLRHLTAGLRKEVIISRGELVQIGGGFRIPEILEASGAVLREVGATNQTSLADYARAIGKRTALLLKVHRSNFFMGGFVASPSIEDLSTLARRRRIPLVEDLGSGAVLDTRRLGGLDHEPTPAEELRAGADLVCFSGDKLLGGPQAGILAGRAALVKRLKREPLFRALRCDKLVLAGLQATVELYFQGGDAAPTRRPNGPRVAELLALAPAELQSRAEALVGALEGQPLAARIVAGKGQVGGGTLPGALLPSVALELRPHTLDPAELAARLRRGAPPILGYVAGGAVRLDLRTVFPDQDNALVAGIAFALGVDGRQADA